MNTARVESLLSELDGLLSGEGRPNPHELAAIRAARLKADAEAERARLIESIDKALERAAPLGQKKVCISTCYDLAKTDVKADRIAKQVVAAYKSAGFNAWYTYTAINRYLVYVELPSLHRRIWWKPSTW